jgi:hypothetical protein
MPDLIPHPRLVPEKMILFWTKQMLQKGLFRPENAATRTRIRNSEPPGSGCRPFPRDSIYLSGNCRSLSNRKYIRTLNRNEEFWQFGTFSAAASKLGCDIRFTKIIEDFSSRDENSLFSVLQ